MKLAEKLINAHEGINDLSKGVVYGNALTERGMYSVLKTFEGDVDRILKKHKANIDVSVKDEKQKNGLYGIKLTLKNRMKAEPEFMSIFSKAKKELVDTLNSLVKEEQGMREGLKALSKYKPDDMDKDQWDFVNKLKKHGFKVDLVDADKGEFQAMYSGIGINFTKGGENTYFEPNLKGFYVKGGEDEMLKQLASLLKVVNNYGGQYNK
jgi:hypothetical protein